ncbi:MAG: RNA-binding protein [Oscillospiraceae bacterium]
MFLSADRNISLSYTHFLDSFEIAQAIQYIGKLKKNYPQVDYTFWGGYDNAERKILCVYSTYIETSFKDFPLKVIEFKYNSNFSKLTHRDFLGAIMSLQVKRNSLGDIIVGDGVSQVVVSNNVCELILNEIDCVGRQGVKSCILDTVTLEVVQNFKEIFSTVPSLRLDCVVGTALNVSRTQAIQLIKSKLVTLNYLEVISPPSLVKSGDVISVRGYGKFIVDSVSSELTKKGRLHILIKKYL